MQRLPLLLASVAATGGAMIVRERRIRDSIERLAAALLETLLRAIDANDPETGRHVRRVARYALILGDAADLDDKTCRSIERVALFHDIGKIDEALFDLIHEDSGLSAEEREAIATHPRRGEEVLAPLHAFYPTLGNGVLAHHERWDGTGYPRGLRSTAIPIEARVVAIADAFDAMTYARRYRSAKSADEARERLREGIGKQFDPRLASLFTSPQVFSRVLASMREDRPQPRRAPAKRENAPDVAFRWRTVTKTHV